jgi:predicted TPR repeat methyltransferase
MPRCCSPDAYADLFNEKLARRDAARYRRKGLKGVSKRLVELVAARGVDDATVLELGGGTGTLQIELLERGAARATNTELSPGYEAVAGELLRERGLTDRVERVVADVVQDPERVHAADVVLLNRVVCCYPDFEAMLATAARKARRLVAFSYPPDSALARGLVRVLNLWPRLRGSDFRAYVHPERAMLETLERRGFQVVARERAGIWRIALAERAAPSPAA